MAWRVAESLEVLRRQLNAAFPERSKASDGGIGDVRHQSSNSDHNAWVKFQGKGIVTARDFTHDPINGIDCHKLADALVESKDPRIKYVIWNRRMCSSYPAHGFKAWQWRPYKGKNAHSHHLHLSVQPEAVLFDSDTPWQISGAVPTTALADTSEKPATTSTSNSNAPVYHQVKSGDTLSGLSKKYGTPVNVIQHLNGMTGTVIKISQIVRVK